MIDQTLLVFAKLPHLGKRRLAAEIGAAAALEANLALHAHTLSEARDPRWQTILCVTPDAATTEQVEVWPPEFERVGQGDGGLGVRLARALAQHKNVAVIGADCPGISRDLIAGAFAALERAPFAMGPAEDGGFWLLAARSGGDAALAMQNVRWSSAHAGADVLQNLNADAAMLPLLYDIDTAADLKRWRS